MNRKINTTMNRIIYMMGLILVLGLILPGCKQKEHTITYDHDCFQLDGKDLYLYSGSMHYFRCPKELWRDRLLKIKRAGLNTVQTYIPWNYHEKRKGDVDLSELDDFLTLCEEMGFYITLRIGPCIVGEWDNGGFPDWLIKERAQLRSGPGKYYAPCAYKYIKHWYDEALPVVKRHQVSEGGRVILVQIENEYGEGSFYKREAIRYMYKLTQNNGIDVPIVTTDTPVAWDNDDPIMANIINEESGRVRWNDVDKAYERVKRTKEREHNAPAIVLEMPGAGGMYSNFVGYTAPKLDPRDYNAVNKTDWMAGAGMTNYYVFHGGTNFGYNPASYISTSYWFRKPIRAALLEPGGIWEAYYVTKLIGQWMEEFGARQVRSKPLSNATSIISGGGRKPPTIQEKVVGEHAFIFIREEEDSRKNIKFSYVDPITQKEVRIPQEDWLTLPPRDMQILVANVEVSDLLVKYSTSQILNIGKAGNRKVMVLYGALGSDGEIVIECKEYPQIEGIDNYIWDEANKLLRINYQHGDEDTHILIDDLELVIVNKERAYRSWDIALKEDTLTLVSDAYFLRDYTGDKDSLNLTVETLPGSSQYTALLPREPEKVTLNNKDLPFEWDKSTHRISFNYTTPSLPQEVIEFDRARFKKEELSKGDWRSIDELKSLEDLDIMGKGYVRYRARFTYQEAKSMIIRFYEGTAKTGKSRQTIGDPTMVFINGKYVSQASGWRGERIRFNPTKYLKEGENLIEVVLEKIGRPCGAGDWGMGEPKGLAAVSLLREEKGRTRLKVVDGWEIKYGLYGQNRGYQKSEFDAGDWKEVNLGNWKQEVRGAENYDGIGWYRFNFNPNLPEGWEIPLKLHLEAETDAIIYLNDILIGRYHGRGWQRDFYLPESWMNPKGENVVTVAVRNSGKEGGIYEASILPYREFSVKQDDIAVKY